MNCEDLLKENEALRKENQELKKKLKLLEEAIKADFPSVQKKLETSSVELKPSPVPAPAPENHPKLSLDEKVALFRKRFSGREDVFARRWESRSSGKSGYQPVCLNEWRPGICDKKKHKCAFCPHRELKRLEDKDFFNHLAGKNELARDVIGLYPIRPDGTVSFLCIDFDDKSCLYGYKDDVKAYLEAAGKAGIPAYVERSRSGNGAHVWTFFESPVPASKARRLGETLLTEAMNIRKQLSLLSFDRMFPNQSEVEPGGFGNLVALPLQGRARKLGNSVFVDAEFNPLLDQWGFLENIKTLSASSLESILSTVPAEEPEPRELQPAEKKEPWRKPQAPKFEKKDFLGTIDLVRANGLYVPLDKMSGRTVLYLKRLASFLNPEFYRRKGSRLSTYNIPRIISCSDIKDNYLVLPRGCEEDVGKLLEKNKIPFKIKDETEKGFALEVSFKGELRPEQKDAVHALKNEGCGILSATTAFGKTIAAIGLIAEKKTNTLILVHSKALLDQWKQRLEEFLEIKGVPEPARKTRRKFSPIGTLDSRGNSLKGFVDIALLQSCLDEKAEDGAKDFLRGYGMVIVDECHHIAAGTFESVLKSLNARFIYGLTATPKRKDGLEPIIFMQCGQIRFSSDSKEQMLKQGIARHLYPRFTGFRDVPDNNWNFLELCKELSQDPARNSLIVEDCAKLVKEGRSPVILTSLKTHVEVLRAALEKELPDASIIALTGEGTAKERRVKMEELQKVSDSDPLVIVATGKYIGEGFDLPRLDSLLLALPISWKGLVQQYAGRLHRDFGGKKEVRIYDYIDFQIPLADVMYRRRLKGYQEVGYSVPVQDEFKRRGLEKSIFSGADYYNVWKEDLESAKHSILIVMPKLPSLPYAILPLLKEKAGAGIACRVVAEKPSPFLDVFRREGIETQISKSTKLYCAVIDKETVWYGKLNYFAPVSSEEAGLRIQDSRLALNLIQEFSGGPVERTLFD